MKKFLAIMIVLTMLFALAIPVLAASDGPSVGPGGAVDGPGGEGGGTGSGEGGNPGGEGSGTGGASGSIAPTSPQTGFEWIGWAAAAAAAILCAGCCFAFARAKKTR